MSHRVAWTFFEKSSRRLPPCLSMKKTLTEGLDNVGGSVHQLSGPKQQPKQKMFWAGYSWDIRDPDVGISRTRTLCKWPFSVVLDREWPGCPGIWVGMSRIWTSFMQENFGLIFRTLRSNCPGLKASFDSLGERKRTF